MTSLFLGIDGGGTRCRARITDASGRCLGQGLAGSANTRLGLDKAFGEIVTATNQALDEAGLPRTALGSLHAGLGLAGLTLASERDKVLSCPHPFAALRAESDAYTACLGAHEGIDGAILVVGTGSCGCALADGGVRTIGGWGFEIGDQGSGAWIGREAARLALWAHDGMTEQTPLGRAIMARFDSDPERMVYWGTAAKPRDFGSLVPLVLDHAGKGDAMALSIVRGAAAAIAAMIESLLRFGAPAVALVGGLSGPMQPYLTSEARSVLVRPKGDAMDGAIRMAQQA